MKTLYEEFFYYLVRANLPLHVCKNSQSAKVMIVSKQIYHQSNKRTGDFMSNLRQVCSVLKNIYFQSFLPIHVRPN